MLAIVLWDTFEVMLLPLPVKRRVRLVMLFFRILWTGWRTLAKILRPGERRERLLGVFGPLPLISLIVAWLMGLIVGFGLLQKSLMHARVTFWECLYTSGATFFTLGTQNGMFSSPGLKIVQVLEAGCGLGFLALVIAYLPVLYQLLSRRETHVMLLAGISMCAVKRRWSTAGGSPARELVRSAR